jgi:hypothetical protein
LLLPNALPTPCRPVRVGRTAQPVVAGIGTVLTSAAASTRHMSFGASDILKMSVECLLAPALLLVISEVRLPAIDKAQFFLISFLFLRTHADPVSWYDV